jgi:hypothetical protein
MLVDPAITLLRQGLDLDGVDRELARQYPKSSADLRMEACIYATQQIRVDGEPDASDSVEADHQALVEAALELLKHGLDPDKIRHLFRQRYTGTSEYVISSAVTVAVERAAAGDAHDAPPSKADSPETSRIPYAPRKRLTPIVDDDDRPTRIKLLQESPLLAFGEACVPAEALREQKITIPAELGRFAFLFSASRLPRHVLVAMDADGKPGKIEVGNADVAEDGHSSLEVEHQRLLKNLFYEAHRGGLCYRELGGNPYLEIKTSLPNLHQLCTPDCRYGSSGQQRVIGQLDDLRDTPVVFDNFTGRRINQPFIYAWQWTPGNGERENVTIWLHWRYSQVFAKGNEALRKPFLLGEYQSISGDYARLAYVHFDWVLSQRSETSLRADTILERGGAFSETHKTARSLEKNVAHQRMRLRLLWQLDGRRLSGGGILRLLEVPAAKKGARTDESFKYLAKCEEPKKDSRKRKQTTSAASQGQEAIGTDVQAPAVVTVLDFYRRQRALWLQQPRSRKYIARWGPAFQGTA